jgi:hypothetical protein
MISKVDYCKSRNRIHKNRMLIISYINDHLLKADGGIVPCCWIDNTFVRSKYDDFSGFIAGEATILCDLIIGVDVALTGFLLFLGVGVCENIKWKQFSNQNSDEIFQYKSILWICKQSNACINGNSSWRARQYQNYIYNETKRHVT